MIKIKKNYLTETKTILNEMDKKPVSKFYIDLNNEGVFIETRMLPNPDCKSDIYNNIKLEVPSMLCLSEVLDALNNTRGMDYNFCKDGVECFTLMYEDSF